jgi:hypothetical protein
MPPLPIRRGRICAALLSLYLSGSLVVSKKDTNEQRQTTTTTTTITMSSGAFDHDGGDRMFNECKVYKVVSTKPIETNIEVFRILKQFLDKQRTEQQQQGDRDVREVSTCNDVRIFANSLIADDGGRIDEILPITPSVMGNHDDGQDDDGHDDDDRHHLPHHVHRSDDVDDNSQIMSSNIVKVEYAETSHRSQVHIAGRDVDNTFEDNLSPSPSEDDDGRKNEKKDKKSKKRKAEKKEAKREAKRAKKEAKKMMKKKNKTKKVKMEP